MYTYFDIRLIGFHMFQIVPIVFRGTPTVNGITASVPVRGTQRVLVDHPRLAPRLPLEKKLRCRSKDGWIFFGGDVDGILMGFNGSFMGLNGILIGFKGGYGDLIGFDG